ncbi:aa3-type cytochrome oxidase subunit II [Protofrankia symbiont of Coriaria ruscifolia]|uniref:Cytochrome c oxidase subunit 2 n=1 Tax=Candidatus Protofrankia californiensis TaxID=1839754 RepID=A0A1C3P8H3_9ACTN|nr:cytochrome c oxidase subunit II [Protofrankia symbiont of Coriaria ruscifolia]SBW26096.1 cytochrome c oxidase subunit II [Candidatus Protofrankia californiensis]
MTRSFGRSRPLPADVEEATASDAAWAGSTNRARGADRYRSRRRGLGLAAGFALLVITVTGCDVPNFGFPDGVTDQTPRILNLWQGSSIAALAVGVFTWGLIFYAIIVFRKRSDELPRQVRYNLPVEILYTVVPLVIVAGLFYYTARDEIEVNKLPSDPDVTINVIGFRWNWQFRYLDTGQNGTVPIEVTGKPGEPAVLVLPQGRTIRFVETSPDVIHSFWVPEFLFKRDVVPGRVNQFQLTITKTGTFVGRCAELCGVDHDRMNFSVKVIPGDEYDRFIAERTRSATVTAAGASTQTSAGTNTPGSGQ